MTNLYFKAVEPTDPEAYQWASFAVPQSLFPPEIAVRVLDSSDYPVIGVYQVFGVVVEYSTFSEAETIRLLKRLDFTPQHLRQFCGECLSRMIALQDAIADDAALVLDASNAFAAGVVPRGHLLATIDMFAESLPEDLNELEQKAAGAIMALQMEEELKTIPAIAAEVIAEGNPTVFSLEIEWQSQRLLKYFDGKVKVGI